MPIVLEAKWDDEPDGELARWRAELVAEHPPGDQWRTVEGRKFEIRNSKFEAKRATPVSPGWPLAADG
jgi:hypothetical protein